MRSAHRVQPEPGELERPDPRVVEDLIARGQISLTRGADEATRRAIEQAATWLYQHALELR